MTMLSTIRPSGRKRPHNPWHTKGGYLWIRGRLERAPTRQAKPWDIDAAPIKAKPARTRRRKVKGGRPAHTYRGARRNAEFGREPKGGRA